MSELTPTCDECGRDLDEIEQANYPTCFDCCWKAEQEGWDKQWEAMHTIER